MEPHTETKPAVFTLKAGLTGIRLGFGNLRRNAALLLAMVTFWSLYSRRNDNSWPEVFERVGWSVGGGLGLAVLYMWLYGHSSVTLTSDELIVRRFGRTQSIPRADVGEIIEGTRDWDFGRGNGPAHYWYVTDTAGHRFVALPQAQWPAGAFEDLARALEIAPRTARSPEEESRLSPWWMRHLVAMILALLAILVLVGALWWGATAWQDGRRASAEREAERNFTSSVEPQLTTSRFPHLQESTHDVATSPLRVIADAEELSEIQLRPSVDLVGPGAEVPATEALDLLDLQCGYSAPGVKVTSSSLTYTPTGRTQDRGLGHDRSIDFECGSDRDSLEKWLAWVETAPDTPNIKGWSYDGDPSDPPEVRVYVTIPSDADFRTTMGHLCAFPAIDALRISINSEDGPGRAPVRCDSPEYSLGEWQNSKDR